MSDKTTAALAAEQADVEATTTQEPELLPAATLDELEQVDLGTVEQGMVRFSFAHQNTEPEVLRAAEAVCGLAGEG